MSLADRFVTHAVENQVPPLAGYNAYLGDRFLRDAVAAEGGEWGEAHLAAYGVHVGGELIELGFAANQHKPQLRSFDRYGHRIDEVDFHPAYHRVLELAMQHGVHAYAWRESRAGAHVVRAALAYLHNQVEQGTSCPLTMTYAAVPALRHQAGVADEWLPRITALEYDGRFMPASGKRAAMMGMGMTEKQGGSDVRANTTRAYPIGDTAFELVGHKWFFSAPMCDAFLVLAQTEAGLGCFLVPRFRPDGSLNAIRIQRLKDKLGNWSNASSEVEFQGAWAQIVGAEGRGVATILDMVSLTRLDCMTGSAGLMRQALTQAIHHCRHRRAFGKRLSEQPLMQNVLADMALEAEAATRLSLRVARAVDAAPRDDREAGFARIATAIGKYWVCKRAAVFVNEAQECLGGAGYVEESILPRLYREAPLNSIWEGSGNIQCLDVLRALSREPAARDALLYEFLDVRGAHGELDREVDGLREAIEQRQINEGNARIWVERIALALQAALLFRAGPPEVAQAFCESRVGGQRAAAFGTLSPDLPLASLVDRAAVEA